MPTTSSGQAAFSILLFQDVAAIPILALLPLLGAAAVGQGAELGASELAVEALKIVGVIGAIVLGGRLLLRPLLRWIAKSKTPEIFTAAALLLVHRFRKSFTFQPFGSRSSSIGSERVGHSSRRCL